MLFREVSMLFWLGTFFAYLDPLALANLYHCRASCASGMLLRASLDQGLQSTQRTLKESRPWLAQETGITVEGRSLEYDCPTTPKPREEGKSAEIIPSPYSNFLKSTVCFGKPKGIGSARPSAR